MFQPLCLCCRPPVRSTAQVYPSSQDSLSVRATQFWRCPYMIRLPRLEIQGSPECCRDENFCVSFSVHGKEKLWLCSSPAIMFLPIVLPFPYAAPFLILLFPVAFPLPFPMSSPAGDYAIAAAGHLPPTAFCQPAKLEKELGADSEGEERQPAQG